MAVRDHMNRVVKFKALIVTCDPSSGLIEATPPDGAVRQIALFDVPSGFTWPQVNEFWSIYEENGYWRLGAKFLSPEERAALQALQPGESWGGVPAEEPPPGPVSDASYVWDQATAGVVWNIVHPLNKYPSVTVVDSAGTQLIAGIQYTDAAHITATFAGATTGKAYLN